MTFILNKLFRQSLPNEQENWALYLGRVIKYDYVVEVAFEIVLTLIMFSPLSQHYSESLGSPGDYDDFHHFYPKEAVVLLIDRSVVRWRWLTLFVARGKSQMLFARVLNYKFACSFKLHQFPRKA